MKKTLIAAAALALLAAPTLAQNNKAGDQQWTTQNVAKEQPFGDIQVDVAALQQVEAMANFRQTLNEQQAAELTGRCDVITGNAGGYDKEVVTFCKMFTGQ